MKDPILAMSGCWSRPRSMLSTILALCVMATIAGCTSTPTDSDYGGNSNSQNVQLTSVKTTNGTGQAVFRVTATNGSTITAYAVKVHGQEVSQPLYGLPTTLNFTQTIASQINAGQDASVDVLEWRDAWHRQSTFTVTWTE